jgi:hypothetical protein
MLHEIITVALMRFASESFTAAQFYGVVRDVDNGSNSRSRRYWRYRGEYHGYIAGCGQDDAGTRLYHLTPHGIAATSYTA